MDRMIALTRTLRARVQSYGDELRRSEALTRYSLIDPLLRELGWDTEDPGIVKPEYSVDIYNGGIARADYALMGDDKPLMMMESKKLGEPLLAGNAVDQGIRDCINTATAYFVVTDGQKWEIYDPRMNVTPPDMKLVAFDLLADTPSQFCAKAVALWRNGVLDGNIVAAPTLEPTGGIGQELIEQSSPATVPATPATPPTPAAGDGWHPLSEFEYQGDIWPAEVMFPDNSRVTARNWAHLKKAVVRWLTSGGRNLSLPISKDNRNLVASEPKHPDGKPFHRSRSEVNGVHVNTDYSRKDTSRNIKVIIHHAGQDAAQFKVRLQ